MCVCMCECMCVGVYGIEEVMRCTLYNFVLNSGFVLATEYF